MFFKKWANPDNLFLFTFVLSQKILQKNCGLQHDSNSYRWSRRRARWPLDHHHGRIYIIVWYVKVIICVIHKNNKILSLVVWRTLWQIAVQNVFWPVETWPVAGQIEAKSWQSFQLQINVLQKVSDYQIWNKVHWCQKLDHYANSLQYFFVAQPLFLSRFYLYPNMCGQS